MVSGVISQAGPSIPKRLPRAEFVDRRQRLLALLPDNSVAIVPAAGVKNRNNDADFPFRQNSDFYYLTGFNEPNAVLVLSKGRKEGEQILFCRKRDRQQEIWDGHRAGPEGAIKEYQFEQAFAISELDEQLLKLLDGSNKLYYDLGDANHLGGEHAGLTGNFDQKILGILGQLRRQVRKGVAVPASVERLDGLTHEMRLIKSAAELDMMRQAAQVSAEAHVKAMQRVKPLMYEYQLEAELHYHFMNQGSRFAAYSSIVGSGANACVLHYVDNCAQIQDGDLVLIDAGCECEYYAADITRTFPANGRFTPEQKALYELVLQAQGAAIDTLTPGTPSDQPQTAATRVLVTGLVELGLLQGQVDRLIEEKAHQRFYMHGIGHWLGMDVHDVGEYKVDGKARPFEVGMVMTIEPGLYIAPDDSTVDSKWRGIGIRIEDDVVITANGPEVITSAVPKEVAAIEALMNEAHSAQMTE